MTKIKTKTDTKVKKGINFSKIFKHTKKYLVPLFLSIVLVIAVIAIYEVILEDKYYPLTFVGDTNLSFLTQGQAISKVESSFQKRTTQKLQFAYPQGFFTIDIATSSASMDYSIFDSSLKQSHAGTIWQQVQTQLQTLFIGSKVTPKVSLDLDQQMQVIQTAVDKPAINAQLTYDETSNNSSPSAQIQIKEGVFGLSLDRERLISEVSNYLLTGKHQTELPLKSVPPKITTQHVQKAKLALENTLKEPIKLVFEGKSWTLDTKQLLTLLDLTGNQDLLLDKSQVFLYLNNIASEIDQPVQEGLFEFNPATKRVSSFKQSQEGRKLNQNSAYQMVVDATNNGSKTINLPVEVVKPKTQTSDVNALGIKELIGSGVSNFAGSIPNRIYNVNLTATKINGVLIPPGEIFSFNQTVGDISAATGFKQAYVIKNGRTVLDDGGGVCQDSTTLFRAVLNAGLPVVKRTAHAYRVGYYEQGFPPGLDATIFYPLVDFQFKNDTPASILIQAYTDGLTLYVDLYGTSDGRISKLTKPVITSQTPPPPELRQDDPTLPKGTVKQVDFAAWGAAVNFSRTVTRGGETLISENFKSNYKAWQAVYLVGTQ